VRWWIWLPLAAVVGVVVAAILLGSSPAPKPFDADPIPPGPPIGEVQVANRSLGGGWELRVFDNNPQGVAAQPEMAFELIDDGQVTDKEGPSPFGGSQLTSGGLVMVSGGAPGTGQGWRTSIYEVTDPSITSVRAVFDGGVVDSMKPIALDDLRFVILSVNEDPSRIRVEGLNKKGDVAATVPFLSPTGY
jgi:hypothetical protein